METIQWLTVVIAAFVAWIAFLVAAIDANRNHANLSSAIRLFVLGVYRDQRR